MANKKELENRIKILEGEVRSLKSTVFGLERTDPYYMCDNRKWNFGHVEEIRDIKANLAEVIDYVYRIDILKGN